MQITGLKALKACIHAFVFLHYVNLVFIIDCLCFEKTRWICHLLHGREDKARIIVTVVRKTKKMSRRRAKIQRRIATKRMMMTKRRRMTMLTVI